MAGEFLNALEQQQRLMKYKAMDNDKDIKRSWKKYMKLSHPNARLSKYQFYEMNWPDYQGGQNTRWSQRHQGS